MTVLDTKIISDPVVRNCHLECLVTLFSISTEFCSFLQIVLSSKPCQQTCSTLRKNWMLRDQVLGM